MLKRKIDVAVVHFAQQYGVEVSISDSRKTKARVGFSPKLCSLRIRKSIRKVLHTPITSRKNAVEL